MASFSLSFIGGLFIGALVLTGLAAAALIFLLLIDNKNKSIW